MTNLPKFLLAADKDRAAWREHPLSREFIELLDWGEAHVADAVLSMVRAGKFEDSRRLDGKLEAFQELKDFIFRRSDAPVAEPEDLFIDPATRPSLLREKKK